MSTEIILSPAPELQPAPLFTPTPAPRMPLDWLVTGDVLDVLPAHAVRGAASIVVTTDPAIYFKPPSGTCEREK